MRKSDIKITVDLDKYVYQNLIEGAKLLQADLYIKRGRNYNITPEYFLRLAVSNELDRLRSGPSFNEN